MKTKKVKTPYYSKYNEGVCEAITKAKGQDKLAKILDCTQATISLWMNCKIFLPVWRALQIEQVLKIKRSKLRPDLWA